MELDGQQNADPVEEIGTNSKGSLPYYSRLTTLAYDLMSASGGKRRI